MKPHVTKQLDNSDGTLTKAADTEVAAEITIDPTIRQNVVNALMRVVQGNGTAAATFEGFPVAQIPVAGKTGTSEIAGKQPTAWFVCFALAGEQCGHGGESAAPLARRILERVFNLHPRGEIRPSVGD